MLWKGRKTSKNVEDRTDDIPPQIPNGTKLVDGTIYQKPKDQTIRINRDLEFNPDDETEMGIVKDLAKRNANKTTPIPTPKPKITHTQVTPGKWVIKKK